MFCDIYTPDGRPFWGDPRFVLRRNLEKAAERGFTFYVHPEMEFFLFKSSDDPAPIDAGGYFDLTPTEVTQELRRETIGVLERMGIPVEFSHHEVAPSQHEIDLRHADALTMADSVMTYRLVVKELAAHAGCTPLHAEAVYRPSGFGDAHAPVALRRRPERVPRFDRRVPPVEGREGVHRRDCSCTRARSLRSRTSGSTPTSV